MIIKFIKTLIYSFNNINKFVRYDRYNVSSNISNIIGTEWLCKHIKVYDLVYLLELIKKKYRRSITAS